MSFNFITEETKNYIKNVLLFINEENEFDPDRRSRTPRTIPNPNLTPGFRPGDLNNYPQVYGSPIPSRTPSRTYTKGKNTYTTTRAPLSYSGKGSGMGDKKASEKFKVNIKDVIDPITLVGSSKIPGTIDPQTQTVSGQGVLNYMSSISKASSAIDTIDQMLASSPTLKLAAATSLLNAFPQAAPKGSSAATTGNKVTGSIGAIKQLPEPVQTLLKTVSDISVSPDLQKNKLFNKVMQYSINTTGFDPADPLGGLRRGFEIMGGQHIRKNVARQGQAQQRGMETTMGHPSGSGNW